MSDAAVTIIVASLAQVLLGVLAFLGLWLRLRYGEAKVDAVVAKTEQVESKLDDNTKLTKAGTTAAAESARDAKTVAATVEKNTETIVAQTNGPVTALGSEVERLTARMEKLEDYSRGRLHDVLDAVNAVHLDIVQIKVKVGLPLPPPATDEQVARATRKPPEGRDAK